MFLTRTTFITLYNNNNNNNKCLILYRLARLIYITKHH